MSLILCSGVVGAIGDVLLPIDLPLQAVIVSVAALWIVYCFFRYKQWKQGWGTFLSYLLAALLLIGYGLTVVLKGWPTVSLCVFGAAVVIPLLLPQVAVPVTHLLVKLTMLIPLPVIFLIAKMMEVSESPSFWLGMSLSFVPSVIAAMIIAVIFIRHENRWQQIISAIGILGNIVLFAYMVRYGSRGPYLAVLLMISFLPAISIDRLLIGSWASNAFQWLRGLRFLGTYTFGILLAAFVVGLSWMFYQMDWEVSVMAKFVKAIEQGDISNGRFEIWLASLRGFCAEPIWGHGIGQISRDLSYVHPHNSVVQLLYDGGLLLLALVLIPTCCIAIRFLRLRTKSLQHIMLVVLLIFLFFISVPNSLLSGDLWSNSRVWLLVGFCLSLFAKNECKWLPWGYGAMACVLAILISIAAIFYLPKQPSSLDKASDINNNPSSSFDKASDISNNPSSSLDKASDINNNPSSSFDKASDISAFSKDTIRVYYLTHAMGAIHNEAEEWDVQPQADAYISNRTPASKEWGMVRKVRYRYIWMNIFKDETYDADVLPHIQQAALAGCTYIYVHARGIEQPTCTCYPEEERYVTPAFEPWDSYLYTNGRYKAHQQGAMENALRYQQKCIHALYEWAEKAEYPVCIQLNIQ